jgi:hypothetical protein
MSLALIQESAKEVRRLAIAGSPLAVGDFRLKKLILPLEQAGAKVPVFAQVAKAISDVVNGKEADASANLLNLSTLLNAILYTQGRTSTEGELRELEMFPSNSASTRTGARVLKPLVQALTSTGGGRFETVKSAVERGAFNDLRLIDPAMQALGDVYPELADLVAEKILPGYGPGIVPLLKTGLDLKGKKSDARRLQIMHELDPAGTLPLCKTALEDGSPEVKAAAIACLGKHEDCLPLVLEQANAKNKSLRAAALDALTAHDLPAVRKLFIGLVQRASLEEAIGPLRLVKNREIFDALIAEAKTALAKALKNETAGVLRYFEILQCLERRTDTPTEEYLVATMSQAVQIAKIKAANCVISGPDILRQLTELLYGIGSPQALNLIIAHQDKIPVDSYRLVLLSALRSWPAEKVFAEFSPLLEQKKGAGKVKYELLERAIYASSHGRGASLLNRYVPDDEEPDEEFNVTWDSRWLDAAIKADRPEAVCYLARPGHKNVVTYLLKRVEAKSKLRPGLVIDALARCQYPKLTDLYLDLVAKGTKGSKRWDYDLQQLLESARYLPPADLPRLEEFAAKLEQNYQDHFLEAIASLRPTSQPGQSL